MWKIEISNPVNQTSQFYLILSLLIRIRSRNSKISLCISQPFFKSQKLYENFKWRTKYGVRHQICWVRYTGSTILNYIVQFLSSFMFFEPFGESFNSNPRFYITARKIRKKMFFNIKKKTWNKIGIPIRIRIVHPKLHKN